MAREPGADDSITLKDNVWYVRINDEAPLIVKTDGIVPNQPILSASLAVPVLSASTGQTTLSDTQHFVAADATSANFGIVLPAAGTVAGRTYTVKKIDVSANSVFLSGSGTETIDSVATKELASVNETFTVISDGAHYHVISHYSGNLGE